MFLQSLSRWVASNGNPTRKITENEAIGPAVNPVWTNWNAIRPMTIIVMGPVNIGECNGSLSVSVEPAYPASPAAVLLLSSSQAARSCTASASQTSVERYQAISCRRACRKFEAALNSNRDPRAWHTNRSNTQGARVHRFTFGDRSRRIPEMRG